ncbi:hypothetical protein [Nostoc sp. LEGE 12450]|uniref:hypothetical protein n=1 Tax=Nostoc sp. LEGE 12450 TaxID=1828643 RepID=UPI00187EF001|nr:hypothetical protein [Nostoc sp. LEGE 12450]MBE8985898.1 hypothetical protein [Nostoc sp. LEGE 12450]
MNTRKAILLITLVFPGLAVVGVSLYWFNLDYAALIKAENYVTNLVEVGKVNDRQLEYAYHRTYIHRINVFADGTWGLLGGVITALGIHGLVTVRDCPRNELTTEAQRTQSEER